MIDGRDLGHALLITGVAAHGQRVLRDDSVDTGDLGTITDQQRPRRGLGGVDRDCHIGPSPQRRDLPGGKNVDSTTSCPVQWNSIGNTRGVPSAATYATRASSVDASRPCAMWLSSRRTSPCGRAASSSWAGVHIQLRYILDADAPGDHRLVLGYGNIATAAIDEATRLLAETVTEATP